VVAPFLLHFSNVVQTRLNRDGSFTALTPEAQSLGSRFLLNNAANQLFADDPLTGVGVGAFPVALRQRYPEFPIDYQPAHFVLLDVAAETGIFGALFYTLAATLPWIALWINRRKIAFTPTFIAASGLLLAVTIVGFLDYYTWLLVPGRIWQWLAWGLWGAIWRGEAVHA
jgi:O-antigen ligase